MTGSASPVLTVVLVALIVAAAAAIVRDVDARVVVVVLVVNLIVLLTGPSYFPHYAALTAAPAAVVLALGADRALAGRPLQRLSPGIEIVLAVAIVLCGVGALRHSIGNAFPRHALRRALPAGCITSDDPQALIQLNRLSSDLRAGCRVPVDVTGITYDTLHRTRPDGKAVGRASNLAWQAWIQQYLTSGTAFVLLRPVHDGFNPEVRAYLHHQPLLATANGLVLRRGNGLAVP